MFILLYYNKGATGALMSAALYGKNMITSNLAETIAKPTGERFIAKPKAVVSAKFNSKSLTTYGSSSGQR